MNTIGLAFIIAIGLYWGVIAASNILTALLCIQLKTPSSSFWKPSLISSIVIPNDFISSGFI